MANKFVKSLELTESEIDVGKKTTNDILKSAGTKVVTSIVAGAVLYGVKLILTKKLDLADLAGYLAPKPERSNEGEVNE